MYKFTVYANAASFRSRARGVWFVVLGDDGLYWVVTAKQARKLETQGYEVL